MTAGRLLLSTSLSACCLVAACAPTRTVASDADAIREIERERLRSLVDVDLDVARRLHTEDFQLINPAGAPLTREEYLGALASGQVDYVAWVAGDITVKVFGDAAVIRYRDTGFDVNSGKDVVHRGPMYHTNLYERRGGEWRIVWSQASGIIRP